MAHSETSLHRAAEAWLSESRLIMRTGHSIVGGRANMSFGMLYVALEHQDAIQALIALGHHQSALALFRPALEAQMRGIWLFHCASETQLKAFHDEGIEPPGYLRLATAVSESAPEYSRFWEFLAAAAPQDIKNDFTHGGREQLLSAVQQLIEGGDRAPENIPVLQRLIAELRFFTCLEMLRVVGAHGQHTFLQAAFDRFNHAARA